MGRIPYIQSKSDPGVSEPRAARAFSGNLEQVREHGQIAGAAGDQKRSGTAQVHERRSALTSWDLMLGRAGFVEDAGVPVNAYLAENLSSVFACTQIISETVATLPLVVYRLAGDGNKELASNHPVARLFSGEPNTLQTPVEFLEMMTAHVLLRGNAFAEIVRDNRGAPAELIPLHPDTVAVLRIPKTRRVVYDVTSPDGGTRRLLGDEVLHLKDRSDDGVIGKSRLARARETFSIAQATETFAASTYRNGARLSGVLSHPEVVGDEALKRIKDSFEQIHRGPTKAGGTMVFEEGLKWTQISVSPEDAQMLESRRFSVEQIARMFRVPPPVLGDLSNGSYNNVTELGRWFYQHTIMPWLTKWERTIERALFSDEGRRNHEVEFDADMLVRGDMLQRFQAYRIGREVGLYSANDLRRFENLNPRTDEDADAFLSPLNMASEQTGEPKDVTARTFLECPKQCQHVRTVTAP
jgi:HK97 family phage portal protein